MKLLAACLLAIALMLRAAPICAAPLQTDAVAMMSECEGAPNHHDEQREQKGDDVALACHACVFPPVAESVLTQPAPAIAVANLPAIEQLSGSAIKPPTPPPRRAAQTNFQHLNGVKS